MILVPVFNNSWVPNFLLFTLYFLLFHMLEFFGRFHPILVHLPIGFLILAVLFQWIGRWSGYSYLRLSVPVILVLGMLSALFACVTGLALSGTADYPESLLGWHQWMGIGTTVLSLGMFWAVQRKKTRETNLIAVMLLAGITITGHMGGSLTHGEDYLSFGPAEIKPTLAPIADIQAVHAYNDLVQPIFEARCVSCHGASKQKGNLRLDEPSFILKGGEDGLAVKPKDVENSELIKRLLLPQDAKKHMPPISKAQLTGAEIQFLQWWVRTGADFEQKINALPQTAQDKQILLDLQTASQDTGNLTKAGSKGATGDGAAAKGSAAAPGNPSGVRKVFSLAASIPEQPVQAAKADLVQRLKELGVVVLPVNRESAYLSVNFVTVGKLIPDSAIALLEGIKEQLIWLKLDDVQLSPAAFSLIGKLNRLTRLQLSNSNLSDESIGNLQNLKELQWLNLVGSKVTTQGLLKLGTLPKLQQLFLYRAAFSTTDLATLQQAFPAVQIDTGNYRLPLLPGDTSLVK